MRDRIARWQEAWTLVWQAPHQDRAPLPSAQFCRMSLTHHAFSPRTSLGRLTDAMASLFTPRLAEHEKAPGVAIHMSGSELP